VKVCSSELNFVANVCLSLPLWASHSDFGQTTFVALAWILGTCCSHYGLAGRGLWV